MWRHISVLNSSDEYMTLFKDASHGGEFKCLNSMMVKSRVAAAGSQRKCCLVQTSHYHTSLHAGMVKFWDEEFWISVCDTSTEINALYGSSAAAMRSIPDSSSV